MDNTKPQSKLLNLDYAKIIRFPEKLKKPVNDNFEQFVLPLEPANDNDLSLK